MAFQHNTAVGMVSGGRVQGSQKAPKRPPVAEIPVADGTRTALLRPGSTPEGGGCAFHAQEGTPVGQNGVRQNGPGVQNDPKTTIPHRNPRC